MENESLASVTKSLAEMLTSSIPTEAMALLSLVPSPNQILQEEITIQSQAPSIPTEAMTLLSLVPSPNQIPQEEITTQSQAPSIPTEAMTSLSLVPSPNQIPQEEITTQSQAPSRGVSLNAAPDPRQDAIHLNTAFKGRGCNTAEIINILAHRDQTQRALIQQEYRSMYSEDLKERLSEELGFAGDISEKLGVKVNVGLNGEFSALSSNLKKAVMLWMLDPAERDATIVGQALTLMTLDLSALTEVICSRTPSEIRLVKKAYFEKYGSQLDADLGLKTHFSHKKLLLACLNAAERDEGTVANQTMVEEDAKKLYKDGEGKWGTEEKTFIRIFTQRNRAHLAAIASAYHHLYGNSLEKAVEKETSGNFMFGLLTLLRCAENPAKYFAKVLYEAMKGMGTSDATLIRVMVTRAEIDMNYIKDEYAKIHGKSLREAIQSDTSGDYRTFLVYLSGPVDTP